MSTPPDLRFDALPEATRTALEAAAFRRLLQHLRDRPDVQNIDLMRLADFCRNCLGKWVAAAAEQQGVPLGKEAAREAVYGMPYAAWKAQHQRPEGPPPEPTRIVAALRYRDAKAAIDWLEAAFGFARHAVYEDGQGGIAHAQLTYRNGMIMLGSAHDDAWGQRHGPVEPGQKQTVALYVVVDDLDAHHAAAVAAGAEIVRPVQATDYGSREYAALDVEGHLWSFGTYDPWAQHEG